MHDIAIVVSPDNASAITSIMEHEYDFVLQPKPIGIVDAIARGLRCVHTPRVVLLCADNVFSKLPNDTPYDRDVIAVRRGITPAEAKRLTPLRVHKEGVSFITHEQYNNLDDVVWIGPVSLETKRLRAAVERAGSLTDIVAVLKDASVDGVSLLAVEMRCEDLGVPEAL